VSKKKYRAFQKQDRAARLTRVQQILLGSPNGVTAAEIGHRTDRDKRTALRDIAALSEINFPVYRDGDRYMVQPGYTLEMPAFTKPELMFLLLATRLAVQHMDYSNEHLAMTLNKLASKLPDGPVRVHVAESASQLAEKPADQGRQRVFEAITKGLLDKKQLKFRYTDAGGKESVRRVHPYFLEPVSLMTRGTYLVAKDIDRREMRIFKLDRIRDAQVLDADAYVPSDFELQKMVASSWGIWTHDKLVRVELVFSPSAARRALETRWHPSQTTQKLRDGCVRITLEVRGVVEITPWILSWGADVEVISPATLRNRLAAIAADMAVNYSAEPSPVR